MARPRRAAVDVETYAAEQHLLPKRNLATDYLMLGQWVRSGAYAKPYPQLVWHCLKLKIAHAALTD